MGFGFISSISYKILLVLCVVLIAVAVNNGHSIKMKELQIDMLTEQHKYDKEKIEQIGAQLTTIAASVENTDASFRRIEGELRTIDASSVRFRKEIERIRNDNKEVEKFLDSRLPDSVIGLLKQHEDTKPSE